ncbi:MAG: hypothetical protein WDN26_23375 [Chitinophagaceae bacterium]
MFYKKIFNTFLVIAFFSNLCFSQRPVPVAQYHLITGNSIIQSKNYYLLTLFQEIPAVNKLLSSDKELAAMSNNKVQALTQAMKDCQRDAMCYTEKMKFSEPEIQAVSKRLTELYQSSNDFKKLVQDHLIASGTYIIYNGVTPEQQLVKAWEQDAAGINFTIGVYAEGKVAKYPLIDSGSLNVRGQGYSQFLLPLLKQYWMIVRNLHFSFFLL